MEKKILACVTKCMGVFTLLIVLCLYNMSSVELVCAWAVETVAQNIMEWTDVQIQHNDTGNGQIQQINIELPENVQGKDITISNNHFTKTISVRFAQGVDDYSDNYSVKGSSSNITSMSYYRDGEAGVLEIVMDKAREYSYSFKDEYLCIEMIDPHDIYDKIVVIDAGHGGRAPGAVKRGVYEKDLNLQIVQAIKAVFDEADNEKIGIYYTRLEDTNPSLQDRVNMANNLDADLFISIHNNASNSGLFTSTHGTQIMYSPSDTSEYNSERFAKICLENVTESAGSRSVGLLKADYIYIIRTSNVPVALIEVGFMTNTEELKKLQEPEYHKKVAEGVYNAVMEAFEEGF